ncbi:MAG: response regulator, partial [Alcaligenaceae bacterium]|nr:response regulator [Alcaligenaceae bacterium]
AMQIESSLRLAAQEKKLAFTMHYPDDMPVYFRGDSLRMLQILTNLVGNAIKFTESGSVEVVFAYHAGMVHVQVRDTGIGMTPQQVEAIFLPFAQADASINRRFGGTGLGTTIARQLAEQMNGRIEVESSLGYGSTFHVRLPLQQGSRPRETGIHAHRRRLPPLNILIADDVSQNLELLTLVLEQEGHHVVSARDGNEAVAHFSASDFDVVLMDVHMPDLDGLQAARLIRQFERKQGRQPTPIIALTASVMEEDREAARQAGMDGFSIKPLEALQLFNEIARVLGMNEAAAGQRASSHAGSEKPVVIDWEYGLSMWGNKEKLLGSLSRFLDGVADQYPLPGAADGNYDRNQALFSLHGLRGVAGNLALPALARLAGELEDSLRSGSEVDPQQFEPLRAQLAQVRQSVAAETAAAVSQAAEAGEGKQQAAAGLVPSMRRLFDVMCCSELDDGLLDTVCGSLEEIGEHRDAQKLRVALDAFEFNEAIGLLEQLIARHSARDV